ncbi:MAG: D-aminoacyl-tRNA deacylase [Thermodesulfobacteriota bacterium]|nr:D-aminoacyl-tRNA deacylase [Thermodesulfobacteriota bacterium]
MRALVQRVSWAKVEVNNTTKDEMSRRGLLVFLGVGKGDTKADADYLLNKVINLRIFEDENSKFNLSLSDIHGELMIISQFTLFGDCRKGKRPSFTEAAEPGHAQDFYDYFIEEAKKKGVIVRTGEFQASMNVSLTNYGPVTILLDSKKQF